MSKPVQEHCFHLGDLAFNYAEIPAAGPPLVLLHGGSARWQALESILPDLAQHWHVYAPDLRGHGQSSWTPGSYRLQDYADDIITFLRQCVERPALLFGHSLGGMIALLVASRDPEGVRAVAVGDAPLSGRAWRAILERSRERLETWRALSGGQVSRDELIDVLKETPVEVPGQRESVPMRTVMGDDSPVFAWLATNMYQNDPDMLSALLDRFDATAAGYAAEVILPAIRCPVLLLQADPAAGGVMTDAEVSRARSLLHQVDHVQLAGLSHAFHNERKEPVVDALTAFFHKYV